MGHWLICASLVDGNDHEEEASDQHERVRVEKVSAIVLNFRLVLHLEERCNCNQIDHKQEWVEVAQLAGQIQKE